MSVDTTTANLKSMPLFADFAESKLEDFQQIFQLVSFAPGACLMTQGHVADSIFFLESGMVEVVVTLPGGGERVISMLGPGSVIGEMALLDDMGTRTATVRAITATRGFLIERQDCRALLIQSQSPAFTVQRRIVLSLCQRMRDLLVMVRSFDASNQPLTPPPVTEPVPLFDIIRHNELPSEYRKMLPLLPFFQHFHQDEIEQILKQAEVRQLPRGHVLFQQDGPVHASYIIIRGAVELVSNTTPHYSFGVLGPGRICGHLALIDNAPHETTAIIRSDAVLLEFSRPSFHQLFTTSTRPAAKFQNALLQSLLILQAKVDNHLARMISQASIRTQRSI